MKTYLIADTHLNHGNIDTYCQRPPDFTDMIRKNWNRTVRPEDVIIHVGDVGIGDWKLFAVESLPGRKILIRGNHDWQHSNQWWMEHGFQFACDGLLFRNAWLSHRPSHYLPSGAKINIHGHLHNCWHGFGGAFKPKSFNRLLSVEYTNYQPVEFEKFVSHPDKYLAIKPSPVELAQWDEKRDRQGWRW